MSNVSFFEYSFNPQIEHPEEIATRLNDLGFICRSKHTFSKFTLWVQNLCILLVRDDVEHEGPGNITGIGCLVDHFTLTNQHDAIPDPDTDFFKTVVNGFNIYLVQEDVLKDNSLPNYEILDTNHNIFNRGLEYFSGIELNLGMNTPDVYYKLTQIGFREDNGKLLSKNNRFTLLLRDGIVGQHTIIIDTQDVFGATARMKLAGVKLQEFNVTPINDFKDLTHKIVGYDCVAFGKYDSHSIENYIPAEVTNFNVIFRQRKQYLKIHEDTLDFYGTTKTQT